MQRYPFQIEWVVNQHFEIDHYQPLLFVVDSFDHLFTLVDELERLDPLEASSTTSPWASRRQRGRPGQFLVVHSGTLRGVPRYLSSSPAVSLALESESASGEGGGAFGFFAASRALKLGRFLGEQPALKLSALNS